MPTVRVIATFDHMARSRGYTPCIVCDNGPKLRGEAMVQWADQHGVSLAFIGPGRPLQALVKSFNGRFLDEFLNEQWFLDLTDAKATLGSWRLGYNAVRLNGQLGGSPSDAYVEYL
jgi:putative transposase